MTDAHSLRGVWSAALTPVDERFAPDAPRAIAYYRDLLSNGCDGINLLGTTGEAMSFGRDARVRYMEAIAQSDLPAGRIMVGTGAASLDDAVAFARAAFGLGFAAALVMPPFFFRDAGDDGVLRFFDALLARAHSPGKRVLLYNFPKMSGIAFHPALVAKLLAAFPEAIAGVKDSSNDPAYQAALIARHPELAVFAAAENYLGEARAYGAAGCISGSVCLWPELASEAYRNGADAALARVRDRRNALAGVPMVPAVRYLVAKERHDRAWERAMPPLSALPAPECAAIDRRLSDLAANGGSLSQ